MQPESDPATFRYLTLVDSQQAEPFQGMTYRSYAPLLASLDAGGAGVAVGATQGDQPVGLAVAHFRGEQEPAQVVSLFVAPEARHHTVGTNLLAELERALIRRNVANVFGIYPSGKETTPHLERIFSRLGWGEPQPRMYLFQCGKASLESALLAPWLKPTDFAPEYQVFPWSEHTAQDRALIQVGLENGIVPATLSPFNEEAIVDLDISLGLRYRGELYGWMICHRLAQWTIRYTALFLRPDIPQKGLGFKLFSQSLYRHLQRERNSPELSACWGVLASNPFAPFLQRRLLPHLVDATYSLTQEVHKILIPVPAEK